VKCLLIIGKEITNIYTFIDSGATRKVCVDTYFVYSHQFEEKILREQRAKKSSIENLWNQDQLQPLKN
jgi:hypothetical protein